MAERLTGIEYELTRIGFFAHYLESHLAEDLKAYDMEHTANDVREAAAYLKKLIGMVQSQA
jgi:hypothetical protein